MSDDDLSALRLLRRDHDLPPEVVDASLERARLRFDAAATATEAPAAATRPRTPRALLRRPVLLAGAAVVVAGGLVASGVGLTHWSAPEPAAAATLHEAARAAAADRTPTGAFTRVVEKEVAMAYTTSDGEHYDEGYLVPTTTTTWVPADVSGTWVRKTVTGEPTTFFGGESAREAAEQERAADGGSSGPVWERGAGGDFTVGELGGEQPGWITPADIGDLPRDPGALVRRIEASTRPVDTTDAEHVFDTVRQLLRTGLVPADLRATMFEALATLPGIVVTEEQASLDGRTGTAIGLPSRNGAERDEIIVDRSSGAYLGERSLQTERLGSIPAGTVVASVALRVTPVDDRP
ncbi:MULTISPECIES: CU044_5270 family protein [unclassified Curtobacterium]|uniref:CU044_5270 family protein n=1 Tax=unclassified Curtobacterium TaxID=257496 RepID=UPI0008DDD689|nr:MULTISPECIES: CU044_5270 family protein [unclassified Curtobacterium]OIH99575.1 hypothetical protein BIU92_01410 [Curtobacterium sp. MCBA15_003]OII11480.1 hypothetical protein BIU97_06205 [Curtobacterium sp. MCBA15_009]OII30590.1 hypothetical protein BIU94_07485 [Curtobacterium sp. MMLR14_006]